MPPHLLPCDRRHAHDDVVGKQEAGAWMLRSAAANKPQQVATQTMDNSVSQIPTLVGQGRDVYASCTAKSGADLRLFED